MSSNPIQLPEGVTLEMLKANWDEANAAYAPIFQRARIIDATDRGKLWKAIGAKFPAYQVLPDTNHVSYVKNNLLASLYSVGRAANLEPTSQEDMETVKHLNIILDHIWTKYEIPFYQMLAGERAALLNVGYTQVGWNNNAIKGTGESFKKGDPVFINVDPMKFMRDPYAPDLDTSAYCMRWDNFNKAVIKRNPKYKVAFATFLETNAGTGTPPANQVEKMKDQPNQAPKDNYRIVTHWVMVGENIHEIHTIDSMYVLAVTPDIKPSMYPFAELFCNVPSEDIIGTSEPSRIFANSVAINLLNSIMLTAEIKNQKPPRFVNTQSQINLRDFIKHGSDSDYVFQVQGDASKAVHYHQFPTISPTIQSVVSNLGFDIQQITGVDGRYTGKDTGSILTTGGMEQMLDQATLIDQPKIVNYERYTMRLTKLVMGNLKHFGMKRTYYAKDKRTMKLVPIEVDYSILKETSIEDFSVSISAHLPKNKQRISQMANVLMEKQMQYNQQGQSPVNLITPEEWLMMQDLPYAEFMLERMGLERNRDYVDKVAKVIFQYAELVDGGMPPEDALIATADAIQSGQPSPYGPSGMQENPEQPMIPPQDVPPAMNF